MVTAEAEKVDITDSEQKIIDQVEYYFSDINLRHDKFMKYQLRENNGWFPLDKLMTFNKLKALSTDKNVILDALKKSPNGLIELSECETKLKRIKPLPEFTPEYTKQLNLRTLHLKGFPKDSTFEQLKTFCSQYGEIDSIEMRRRDGNFKGCIMVVFKDQATADKVLAIDGLKYNDIELLKENKERYFERKRLFLESIRNKKKNKKSTDEGIIKTEGAIMKITDLSAETKYIQIKNELSKHSKVAFVTAIGESRQCMVRFDEKNGAKRALKALREQSIKKDTVNDDGDAKNDEKDDKEKTEDNKDNEDNKDKEEKNDEKSEDKEDKTDEKSENNKDSNGKEKNDDEEDLTKEFAVELCGQNIKVSLVSGEDEKNYWIDFNQSRQQSNMERSKKNKWQKGKKRHFDNKGRDADQEPKKKMAKVEE
uniref:Lupus La protein homolog n=1 Tax=Dermatophagoides pteronyssinus TaxID=6956 RepID=A0A6P6XRH7_DERPT|nr:lupus La protein homolog [Dermatophagoides pteronyssinus]